MSGLLVQQHFPQAGVTEQEIQEVLLQTMACCGAPAALESFRVAEAVLAETRHQ